MAKSLGIYIYALATLFVRVFFRLAAVLCHYFSYDARIYNFLRFFIELIVGEWYCMRLRLWMSKTLNFFYNYTAYVTSFMTVALPLEMCLLNIDKVSESYMRSVGWTSLHIWNRIDVCKTTFQNSTWTNNLMQFNAGCNFV